MTNNETDTAIAKATLILREILENAPEGVKGLDYSVQPGLISIECRDCVHVQAVVRATWHKLLNAFWQTTLPYSILDIAYKYGDGNALTFPLDV